MGKLRGVMTGVFLGGVLLGGIGTGIAMVEYSSLSYGGERLIGEEYLVTKNLDFDFPQDGRKLILKSDYYNYSAYKDITVEIDDSVPAGTVRYELTYNENAVAPELIFQEYEDERENLENEDPGGLEESWETDRETQGKTESVYLGMLSLRSYSCDDGFAAFMENKDRFLEELKEKKISSYRQVYITDLKVKVNSQTRPFVEMRNTWYQD